MKAVDNAKKDNTHQINSLQNNLGADDLKSKDQASIGNQLDSTDKYNDKKKSNLNEIAMNFPTNVFSNSSKYVQSVKSTKKL